MFITHSETPHISEKVRRILIKQRKLGEFKKFLLKNSFDNNILSLIYSDIRDHVDVDKIMKYLDNCPNSYAIVCDILGLIRENADESILNLIYDENNNIRSYYEIASIRILFRKGYDEKQIRTFLLQETCLS